MHGVPDEAAVVPRRDGVAEAQEGVEVGEEAVLVARVAVRTRRLSRKAGKWLRFARLVALRSLSGLRCRAAFAVSCWRRVDAAVCLHGGTGKGWESSGALSK